MTQPLAVATAARYRAYGPRQLNEISARFGIPAPVRETARLLSQVFPFRVNEYVLTNLIDWRQVPDDPIYQMVFPQPTMLSIKDTKRLAGLTGAELSSAVRDIRARLNPHPSGQRELNVPTLDGAELPGMQHKYRETVLYFPGHGQTCHAYCTYCFRWAQFVGDPDLQFAAPDPCRLVGYLGRHPEVSDVLVTGGDPLVMSTDRLRAHLEPILAVESVRTIRLGTKSVAYWPYRFTADRDADDLLRLFEQIVTTGRTVAVMAHFSHPRELDPEVAQHAVARIRATGAVVYCQAPLIARVNDQAEIWTRLWRAELGLGAVPYYLFVERDTGPHDYFKVPLARAVEIFQAAYRDLPGLARTVRGPVMSAKPGKVVVDGAAGEFLQLRFLQARDPALVGRPFLARYPAGAAWLDELALDPSTPADIAAAIQG
ncbi:KamA family radical SAM protein [Amycolatopsis taiwanensis]|uniref:KamA family radical SAM protein n=1 Tax=Amycolatopsis taiwanensis TaxID=342230 RepID=UPI000484CBA4|nr:lysine 2,3-aminomutase [Amycolatopsis taiwanensis]